MSARGLAAARIVLAAPTSRQMQVDGVKHALKSLSVDVFLGHSQRFS